MNNLRRQTLSRTIALSGFVNNPLCDYDGTVGLRGAVTSMIQDGASAAVIQKAAADEIRVTVAHEIGHTLGLRHNFAGSLAANYTMPERAKLVRKFLKTGRTPKGVVVTSSVMEYTRLKDDFMVGDQIAHGVVLSQDKAAIRFLYDGVRPKKWPLYCTDSAIGRLYDCQQFDAGSSEVAYIAYHTQQLLKDLPNYILETYIGKKTPFQNQLPTPVAEVVLPNAKTLAQSILAPRLALMKQFTNLAGIVSVQQKFSAVGEFDSTAVQSQQERYLLKQILQNGGFAKLFAFLPDNFVQIEMSQLDSLLNGAYRHGLGNDRREFSFSNSDVKMIESNAQFFFQAFQREYNKQNLDLLAGKGMKKLKFARGSLANAFGSYLANVEKAMLFKESAESVSVTINQPASSKSNHQSKHQSKIQTTTKTVQLPVFEKSLNYRLKAASLLAASRSEDPMWMFLDRSALQFQFKDLLNKTFGFDPSTLNKEKLPPLALQWLIENNMVRDALNASGS